MYLRQLKLICMSEGYTMACLVLGGNGLQSCFGVNKDFGLFGFTFWLVFFAVCLL